MHTREQQLQEIFASLLKWASEAPTATAPAKTELEKNMAIMLRADEGEVLHAYPDSEGYWTIGIGVLIDKRKGGGITREESEYLFMNRMRSKAAELDQRLSWWRRLNDARQGVLLGMAFQMGVDGLLGFVNTLEMVKVDDYQNAAKGMLNSKWARQTPERAKRMAEQMRTGAWQIQ